MLHVLNTHGGYTCANPIFESEQCDIDLVLNIAKRDYRIRFASPLAQYPGLLHPRPDSYVESHHHHPLNLSRLLTVFLSRCQANLLGTMLTFPSCEPFLQCC